MIQIWEKWHIRVFYAGKKTEWKARVLRPKKQNQVHQSIVGKSCAVWTYCGTIFAL